MQFRTLRLAGFKSFVEPAELDIAAGLTGIVGPNGCGKSNIVEALRWAMGETSARRMRGGEMDDVIFAGSGNRPPRNIAEVTLVVTNDGGSVPAQFEKFPELEIRRRIERGAGSDYRVNGRPVRARDVQLLFADAAIGADSPAMVSQGRIAALIAAKPSERRFILEDAAGIGGLQSRRHEAELKLKAAEGNLAQLETMLGTLRGQESALKRQARQAEKYRQLAERIRAVEALLLYCAWSEANARLDTARLVFDEIEGKVRAVMADVTSAAARESTADAAVTIARQADSEAQDALRTLRGREQALQAEKRQIAAARAEAERDIARSESDLEHEERERDEAAAALQRLAAEKIMIEARQPEIREALRQAGAAERREIDSVRAAEETVLATSTAIARAEAQEVGLAKAIRDAEQRRDAAVQRQEAAAHEVKVAKEATSSGGELSALEADAANARARLQKAQEAVEPVRAERMALESRLAAIRDEADVAHGVETRMKAEIAGLEAGLATGGKADPVKPILESIASRQGFEAALAAALGEDAKASAESTSPYRWMDLPPMALTAPEGSIALVTMVDIPSSLRRALAGVGVAPAAEAAQLQKTLLPGQAIVTPEGSLLRWDGLVREAGSQVVAPVAATLAQRNRLVELRAGLAKAEQASRAAFATAQDLRAAVEAAMLREHAATQEVTVALSRVQRADNALSTARARAEQAIRREQQAGAALDSATQQATEARASLQSLQTDRTRLPNLAAGRESLRMAQQGLGEARARLSAASAEAREQRQTLDALTSRLDAITSESLAWEGRAKTRVDRLAEIATRITMARDTLTGFGERPVAIDVELARLSGHIEDAEQACRVTSAASIRAETELAEHRREARQTEQHLASLREDRVRAESAMEVARQSVKETQDQISQRLHVAADELAETVAADGGKADRGELEWRLATLTREREAMGPVNLRAETELAEAAAEISRVEAERADLAEAIARLRQAIGKLNREARERLAAAFETVRVHFKRLFLTLFGGGEAELALTDMADPLEAGLEIFASPPGKKLQILSLLSGGEQALTALALLFAMFLATPAPVCVLDEVDAPLDDANVTRFCDLLDEIAATTGTRFLVITHHRVTMARMDRLYGVTMAERGVSMLVSVDLSTAESLVEPGEDGALPLRVRGGTR